MTQAADVYTLRIVPVILAGGTGTRLWPLSRSQYPKQFLPLCGEFSLLQQTLQRVQQPVAGIQWLPPVLLCQQDHRFIVAEQLRQLGIEGASVLLEPSGRGSAAAIALAAHAVIDAADHAPPPLMLVLPADHVIREPLAWYQAIRSAAPAAEQGKLLTFGITPSYPETGYGYIRAGALLQQAESGFALHQVDAFVEKPPLDVAQAYVESGQYHWNSGMFLLSAAAVSVELAQHSPEVAAHCAAAWQARQPLHEFISLNNPHFLACPNQAFDRAVMEATSHACMVPLSAGWNDVGSFQALWQESPQDAFGNVLRGDIVLSRSQQNFVYSDQQVVSLIGVDNMVVVSTVDALLVMPRHESQQLTEVLTQLTAQQRPQLVEHRSVYRPWGKYDLVDRGETFQVKRITVNVGACLSTQLHRHRAEHWVVVAGVARVVVDGIERVLEANQSVYIAPTQVHRLENAGDTPLELIEVQSGNYLGEDDIVRFDDKYGRD